MNLNVGTLGGSIEEHFPENLILYNFKKSHDILLVDGDSQILLFSSSC